MFPFGGYSRVLALKAPCMQYSYSGRTIVFPIKIHCFLQWTRPDGFIRLTDGTVKHKSRVFVEMIRVYIKKINCN